MKVIFAAEDIMIKLNKNLKKIMTSVLAMSMSFALVACDMTESNGTDASSSSTATETVQVYREVTNANLSEVEEYLDSIVNGSYRELRSFPMFTQLGELPAVAFADGNLLQEAGGNASLESISRTDYQLFLQQYFNSGITLPESVNYQRGFDRENDVFNLNRERTERNFFPETYWQDAMITQEGNTVYYDAYEFNYEFVNNDTGLDETGNPLARIVVDEVTIGFATPIVQREVRMLDYLPLAKTRYTLEVQRNGDLNLISKTRLDGDEAYKASAREAFANVRAVFGQANVDGTLSIRTHPQEGATLLGTLEDTTNLWYIDPLPESDFYIVAPAARSAVFNYKIGFGFSLKSEIS